MKKFITGLGMALVLLLAMSSCEDEEAKGELTDGTWEFSDMTTDHENEAVQTLVLGLKAGHTGATLVFSDDATYTYSIPLAGDPETGTWTLIGDDMLNMTKDGDDYPAVYNIETLSTSKLVYLRTLVDPQTTTTFTVTVSWTR